MVQSQSRLCIGMLDQAGQVMNPSPEQVMEMLGGFRGERDNAGGRRMRRRTSVPVMMFFGLNMVQTKGRQSMMLQKTGRLVRENTTINQSPT